MGDFIKFLAKYATELRLLGGLFGVIFNRLPLDPQDKRRAVESLEFLQSAADRIEAGLAEVNAAIDRDSLKDIVRELLPEILPDLLGGAVEGSARARASAPAPSERGQAVADQARKDARNAARRQARAKAKGS